MATSETSPDANAMMADLVTIATACPVRAGKYAMSLPIWPDRTAPAT